MVEVRRRVRACCAIVRCIRLVFGRAFAARAREREREREREGGGASQPTWSAFGGAPRAAARRAPPSARGAFAPTKWPQAHARERNERANRQKKAAGGGRCGTGARAPNSAARASSCAPCAPPSRPENGASASQQCRRPERAEPGGARARAGREATKSSARQTRAPWMSSVASPPSSTSMSGPPPSGQVSICSVHHQYSSSVSPFQAKTAAESRAIAAAA